QVVLRTLAALGMTKLITVDVHNPRILDAYRPSSIDLSATEPIAAWLSTQDVTDPVLISPDRGGTRRTEAIGRRLGWPVYVCDKHKNAAGHTWYEGVGRALSGADVV